MRGKAAGPGRNGRKSLKGTVPLRVCLGGRTGESSVQPGGLAWTRDDACTMRERGRDKGLGLHSLKGEGMGLPPDGALPVSLVC